MRDLPGDASPAKEKPHGLVPAHLVQQAGQVGVHLCVGYSGGEGVLQNKNQLFDVPQVNFNVVTIYNNGGKRFF